MTVEKLNQYINNRLRGMQEAFDKALETYDGYTVPVSIRINAAATRAEKDIDHAIWNMTEDELPLEDQQRMVRLLQRIISDMRMDAVDILLAKERR